MMIVETMTLGSKLLSSTVEHIIFALDFAIRRKEHTAACTSFLSIILELAIIQITTS